MNTKDNNNLDQSFASLALKPELLDNLASLDYKEMTAIQAQSLPLILENQDVIGQAKTGSGKTAAFGLGLLARLNVKRFRIQALILCPTRELADQVATEVRKLARGIHNLKVLTICGGTPFGPQANSLRHGAHIIVGTPGRVEDHIRKGNLSFDELNCLVLDEADRMLESGFQDSIDEIVRTLPRQRQTLLFSATFPNKIQALAAHIMQSPEHVDATQSEARASIDERFVDIEQLDRSQLGRQSRLTKHDLEMDALQRIAAVHLLLLENRPSSCMIFCNTKKECSQIAQILSDSGFSALALHGDLEQNQRDKTLVRFAHKSVSILVATDVAARGIDIDQLDMVINYQIARELDVHTHRVGRTGRAGEHGIAFTLYSEKEQYKLNKLDQRMQRAGVDQVFETLAPLSALDKPRFKAAMVTLQIDGGKKQKVRPGDVVGALTSSESINGTDIGKIKVFDFSTYVSVKRDLAHEALSTLSHKKIKAKSFKVRRI